MLPPSIWVLGDKKRKANPLEEQLFREIREGKRKEEDAFGHRVTFAPGGDSVLVAKPSPKPFAASLGSISEVPYEPGLLFPYFHGQIVCDTRGLRVLASKLFFRNFGKATDSDARAGFQEFRVNAGLIASSSVGPILAHILKGFELALDAQAHAFLIFDNSDYLGFALLGDHYYVHNGMNWVEPLEASILKDEMKELQTHNITLGGIVVALGLMKDHDGHLIEVEQVEIETPKGLLTVLATVDESQGDSVKDLGRLIQGLKFKGAFKEVSPRNVVWALDQLTFDSDSDLGDMNLYIPLSNWAECGSRVFQVFATFGPRAFHLFNKRGQTFAVPRLENDADPLSTVTGNPPVREYPRILLYPCTVHEAVSKWNTFISNGLVCMDFDERAKGSRAISWESANRDMVWGKMKEIGRGGFIQDRVEAVVPKNNGKKRSRPTDFDDGEFDSILGL